MKHFRRLVIVSHRYLGIVLSLLVIMWFATGITMMYWGGMPRVTPELRRALAARTKPELSLR